MPSPGDQVQRLLGRFRATGRFIYWGKDPIITRDTAGEIFDLVDKASVTLIQANLAAHVADTDNPHETTAAQVGTYTAAQIDALFASFNFGDVADYDLDGGDANSVSFNAMIDGGTAYREAPFDGGSA